MATINSIMLKPPSRVAALLACRISLSNSRFNCNPQGCRWCSSGKR